jgi:6-pyruvoyltetrahydropterin/6-carboxytetrahydropterin synthase
MSLINIEKKYHFHAAHRNELINDKCKNLHGHTYHVTLSFPMSDPGKNGITMLFSDIDKIVEPVINKLDHSTLMNQNDPLLQYLNDYSLSYKDELKINVFPFPTSAENIAKYIMTAVKKAGLPCCQIKLAETTSSEVIILDFK